MVTKHKEEFESRIKSDANDRKNIRNMLKTCVDPLDPMGHPVEIFNIVKLTRALGAGFCCKGRCQPRPHSNGAVATPHVYLNGKLLDMANMS